MRFVVRDDVVVVGPASAEHVVLCVSAASVEVDIDARDGERILLADGRRSGFPPTFDDDPPEEPLCLAVRRKLNSVVDMVKVDFWRQKVSRASFQICSLTRSVDV